MSVDTMRRAIPVPEAENIVLVVFLGDLRGIFRKSVKNSDRTSLSVARLNSSECPACKDEKHENRELLPLRKKKNRIAEDEGLDCACRQSPIDAGFGRFSPRRPIAPRFAVKPVDIRRSGGHRAGHRSVREAASRIVLQFAAGDGSRVGTLGERIAKSVMRDGKRAAPVAGRTGDIVKTGV
jgi:hypothetical protein